MQSDENEDPSNRPAVPANNTRRPYVRRANQIKTRNVKPKTEAEKAEQRTASQVQTTSSANPIEAAPVVSLPATIEKGVGGCTEPSVPPVTTDQAIDISGTLSNASSQGTAANPSQSSQENVPPVKADPEVEQVEDFTHLLFPSVQAFKDTTNLAVTQKPTTKQVQHTHGAGQTCKGCDKVK